MTYQALLPITREEAENALSGVITEEERAEVLLRLSLCAGEGAWKQHLFESDLTSASAVLHYAAIRALGHLARVEPGSFDPQRAVEALQPFRAHDILAGAAEDAQEDIEMYTRR